MADQEQPLMSNQGGNDLDQKFTNARQSLQKQNLPVINFTISVIMLFAIPLISQLSNEFDRGVFGFGGSFIFILMVFFSILGMYGLQKQENWATTIYRNACAIYCIGMLAVFIVAIITLATKKYNIFSEATGVIFAIIGLPYSIWMAISFYFIHKQMGAMSQQSE